GCRVIGSDFDPAKVALARSFGVEAVDPRVDGDLETAVAAATAGVGADGVIITASAKSDEIIHQACQMCRKRGRIVLVGVIGMNMRRDDFYKKELSFQVSCSYGAGRYDEEYEQKGHDYPLPYVRWTEQRNFETVLRALSTGALRVEPLITESVELKDYLEIYGDMRKAGSIASLIRFPEAAPLERRIAVAPADLRQGAAGRIALIGAGNFASSTIVPCLKKAHAAIRGISSAQGLSAKILAKKAGAELATSDTEALLNDPQVSTVIVCARHNLHAPLVKRALAAGKSVFVEKPLCLNREELAGIEEAYRAAGPVFTLTVCFNRRFSPFAEKLKLLSGAGPKHIVATMNAGFIAPEVWVQDMEIGGGRIVGEACHFIDLCSYLADSHVVAVCMNALGEHPDVGTDNASILLRYANGSNAVVNYFSNGSKAYAKERVEVFSQGSVLVLDNWRKLTGYGVRGFSSFSAGLDKGHRAQFALLAERAVCGGEALIPFASIKNTTLASFACLESLKQGKWIELEA
ncbi:MAG: Gfo/Idh/MocA family oxidoreductase, partial [Lentisphaeria bacterium]|nr:Gfo/Idh/MocA family oxidoreductase [Lentisphaeria bacterium]